MTLPSFRRSLVELLKGRDRLDAAWFRALLGEIETRLRPLEDGRDELDALMEQLRQVALDRINLVLTPALVESQEVRDEVVAALAEFVADAATALSGLATDKTAALSGFADEKTAILAAFVAEADALIADLQAGVVPASGITMAPVDGLEASNVQAAVAELLTKLSEAFSPLGERNAPDGYAGLDSEGKLPASLIPPTATVETFLASGNWTKPEGCTVVAVRGYGAGGGGCAGYTNIRAGGGGGGGGSPPIMFLNADDLPSSVTVTIGAGGVGGTTLGQAGTDGGDTSFGSYYVARGGKGTNGTNGGQGGGEGPTAGAAFSWQPASAGGTAEYGGAGGGDGRSASPFAGVAGGSALVGGGGGGGGSYSGGTYAGGVGGRTGTRTVGGGGTGAVGDGGNGGSVSGGVASPPSSGGIGGGGGGGSATASSYSAGGDGGDGYLIVWCW